jgi:ubiquinone/menaquinone biosynthesis C-methylase UbiE
MTHDIKTSVQTRFGSTAANYATSPVHASGEDLAEMVNCAALTGSERVLDAGCGAGHTGLTFAPHVKEVVAYDLTPTMLEQVERLVAERGITNLVTQQGDVENLPFEDSTFDRVVTRYSAHHWPHPDAALREFARVLKPGGLFILSDIVGPDDFAQDTFLQAIELLRDNSHVRDHSIRQWSAMISEAGFDPVEVVFTWDVVLDFDAWVERIATPPANVAMMKVLYDDAPQEIRAAMQIQPDYTFTFKGGLLRGQVAK